MASERRQLVALLDQALAQGAPKRCTVVAARGDPPVVATVSPVPRLLLAVRGSGRMAAAGCGTFPLAVGDCVAINPGRWNQPLGSGMSFVVLFDYGDHLRANCWHQWSRRGRRRATITAMADRVPVALQHAWQALISVQHVDVDAAPALCAAVLRLARHHLAEAEDELHPAQRLQRAILAWIDEHLHEAIDRSDAAAAFGVHPNHVTRVFALHGEQGFTTTLITRRLERAAALLRESELPVAAVGELCGYGDPAAFSAAFRRHFGSSPRSYRQGG